MVLETAAIVTAAKPLVGKLVGKIVEELITPKIKQFANWCKDEYNEKMIPTAEHFQEYLERTYEKYSCIKVLAIPNSQLQLKDIYVTQSLVKYNRFESEDDTTIINRLPTELIKKYKKLLITDTAGMGKSTIMKYMFIDLIDKGLNEVGIPIFIELNRLNKNRSVLIEIQEEMDSLSQKFDTYLLFKLIQTGGFIFFLDGYDEISIADRSEVIQDIQSFISKAGTKNYYILSSRPEDSLASFGDFQSFKIQPLTKEEAFELLTKYDISSQKKISEELIKELKTGKYDSIDEYLVNPLLVSLLYIAFNYKAEIPLKKHQFYRQVYDALFNSHNLAQGQKPHEKRSELDIDDFDQVLRYVGYECLIHIGVQFDKDTILNSIKKARDFCGNMKFAESDFLNDLVTSVPLFSKDGIGYRWNHKSLMEYFAARYIAEDAKKKQDLILSKLYNSEDNYKYINMLDIYYDVDYKSFSKNITLPLCEEYVKFYETNSYDNAHLDHELIDNRISCLYCGNLKAFVLFSNKDIQLDEAIDSAHNIFHEQLGVEGESSSVRFVPPTNNYICCLYISDMNYINKVLLIRMLVQRKVPSLFKECKYNFKPVIHFLEFEKAYELNAEVGAEDKHIYEDINTILFNSSPYMLDYKSCKTEIESIKKALSQIENDSDLLIGI